MIADPALLLVDFQKGFCKQRDEASGTFAEGNELQPAIDATAPFLERYRETGRTPIFIGGRHHEHTVSEPWAEKYDRPRGMSVPAGSTEAEFVPELAPEPDDPVVWKNRYNAFYGTNLDLYLSTNDVSHVLVAGVTTGVCVLSTVMGAYNRDYHVTVLGDCTATTVPARQDVILDLFESNFGRVRDSTAVELPPIAGD